MLTESQMIIYYFLILVCFSCCKACCDNPDENGNGVKIKDSNVSISYVTKYCCREGQNEGYTTKQKNYKDNFPAAAIQCFSYRVKSPNQTHIGLFSTNNPPKTNPWIEVVIGGLPNGLGNIFRKNGADISGTYNQQKNSLNQYEYRGFWISWVGGNIRVGYRGQPPFMTWQDPNPFQVNYVGVDTCCGTTAHVIVEEPKCPGINM